MTTKFVKVQKVEEGLRFLENGKKKCHVCPCPMSS
jgi:hypothetical protein